MNLFFRKCTYMKPYYTKCYCEENIYRLMEEQGNESLTHAVFISNPSQRVPFWCGRQSIEIDGFTVWDYHVVAINKPGGLVYDFDSSIPFPVGFEEYCRKALRVSEMNQVRAEFHRMYRVIDRQEFLSTFSSDRLHMIDGSGNFHSPPPILEPILHGPSNLESFISMSSTVKDDKGPGRLLSEDKFLAEFEC